MSLKLTIFLVIFSAILFIITTIHLKKNLIPVKYSLLWYFIALIILSVVIFSPTINQITHFIGFETTSNLVIGIIIVLLIFLTMSLTIIISDQCKKITLLTQELSLLKNQIEGIVKDSSKQSDSHKESKPKK